MSEAPRRPGRLRRGLDRLWTAIGRQGGRLDLRFGELEDIAAKPDSRVRLLASHEPALVAVAPTRGLECLPDGGKSAGMHVPAYLSVAPKLFEVSDAILYGSAGILTVDGTVWPWSTWHTDPRRDGYRRRPDGISIPTRSVTAIRGTYLSLLCGSPHTYFHALLDGVARLALVPDEMLPDLDGILLPAGGGAMRGLLDLYGLPRGLEFRFVEPGETLRTDRLLVPASLHGVFSYHPGLNAVFDRIVQRLPPPPGASGRRIVVDRRGAARRPLVNEAEVIAALERLGFEAVRLETLPVMAQAELFRDAAVIVAAHGSGLANLGFARPGTSVIELMPDRYPSCAFQRLAALRGLDYACVVGQVSGTRTAAPALRRRRWTVPVDAVLDAVGAGLT